jgi:hypothetical protein
MLMPQRRISRGGTFTKQIHLLPPNSEGYAFLVRLRNNNGVSCHHTLSRSWLDDDDDKDKATHSAKALHRVISIDTRNTIATGRK